MLTRRTVVLSGAAAGAFPLLSNYSLFAEQPTSVKTNQVSLAGVTFSPELAHYIASSGSVLRQKMAHKGPSVSSFKAASSLVHMAANHTQQNSMDTLVRAVLQKRPEVAKPENIHAALTNAFEAYQKYDPDANMPDLSSILTMKPEDLAKAQDYVARVGITGTFRDLATMFGTVAHNKKSVGLSQAGLFLKNGGMISDGLWHPDHPLRLQHVQQSCKLPDFKKMLCSFDASNTLVTSGLVMATLLFICTGWVQPFVEALFPEFSAGIAIGCLYVNTSPVQAAAAVAGFILALISYVQLKVC